MTAPNPQLAQALLVSVALTRRSDLTAMEARRVLGAYGIACVPQVGVAHPQAARRAAARLGYPVRVAADGAGVERVVHGPALADGDALEQAVNALARSVDLHDPTGLFLIQAARPQASTARVWVERADDDTVLHVTVGDATGSAPATAFVSGTAPLDALSPAGPWGELLSRIAQLALHFPELARVDLDPVYVDAEAGAVEVGAAALSVDVAE